ncbi:hypothetical protein CPI84_12870 [Erwinia pyrifoliae]|nr:hypothetical protein CPI84_12870 [Erwinia pyrifoliae]MCA8876419.1 hypothetical protein [Erwinia pyrifoliae]
MPALPLSRGRIKYFNQPDFSLPSLFIQPLVKNAIVHGIHPCRGKGVVTSAISTISTMPKRMRS